MSKVEVDQVDPQSGTTLTLGTSGDTVSIPSGVTLANAGTVTGIPTSALTGTIATAQIADDAVTLAKMAPGTDGNIISYDASGNPVAVATGSSGQVLTSAGAGAVPSFQTAAAGGKILQVIHGTSTGFTTTTSSSFSATGLKASITPSNTNSNLLVLIDINGIEAGGTSNRNISFKLYRAGSFLDWIIDGYSYNIATSIGNVGYNKLFGGQLNSGSALEFELFFAEQGGSGSQVGINNYVSSNNTSTSGITLMEVAT